MEYHNLKCSYEEDTNTVIFYLSDEARDIIDNLPDDEYEQAIEVLELDGDTVNNVDAFEKVVRIMHDNDIGYGAINHPVDRDPICGFNGVIDKPDGWYLPKDKSKVAIVLETKSEKEDLENSKWVAELMKNIDIVK